ncbi:MAG: aminopeptidase [Thiohalophilus sp.]|jgi:predicted aminopeptidase
MPKIFHQLLLLCLAGLLTGCGSFSYYIDAINGHAEILNNQRPVSEVIDSPETPESVRNALRNFQEARRYAVEKLYLPDNDSYHYYTDIKRDYAVWNVVATPEFSVEPEQWCFIFAGCFNYQGFFTEQQAKQFANKLNHQGYDTYVAGSRAYSTLGWFDDPLLNTMLLQNEASRIGILFHELAHQKLYLDNDPAFSEAFAVFIEQEGVSRWLAARVESDALKQYQQTLQRRSQFHSLLLATRNSLDRLYKSDLSESSKRERKNQLFEQLKLDYAKLKTGWGGYAGYDKWMGQALNNAHLALVATYREQVDNFQSLLTRLNGDLPAFYQEVERIAALPLKERHEALVRQ